MATTTTEVISKIRELTGDNDSTNYFISDDQWESWLDSILQKMAPVAGKEAEATISLSSALEYDLPDGVDPELIDGIYYTYGSSYPLHPLNYRIHHGKIRLHSTPASGTMLIWYKKPYELDTDTIPQKDLEILYLWARLYFVDYALMKRADFEQWAALSRSDASINQLILLRRELERQLIQAYNERGANVKVNTI